MELIVISDPLYFKDEAYLINQLFEAGMPVFHLRKEGNDRLSYTKLIAGIDACYHHQIALHHFHELAISFPSIKRLHYPEKFRKEYFGIPMAKDLLRNKDNPVLSTSTHCLEDLKYLPGFDYTFYSPVFHSLSKPGYAGKASADFKLPEQKSQAKIIALGGIDKEKVIQVKRMGFDGFAVLGAIWNKRGYALENLKQLMKKNKENFNSFI